MMNEARGRVGSSYKENLKRHMYIAAIDKTSGCWQRSVERSPHGPATFSSNRVQS